ncbi:hypothetical protein KM540_gp164 [Western grey kangaroopox virus]|uniref:Uncharacterized protein n=1 Tax=Western grey kangaroopox virus TaxID=1566307 RepID=A0A2C9DSW2_9POXV|nr:hypothetical protein KM540_gp002 [Western grey kangaroopox virus]YP_010085285.1 hypothetical protein KM540_gp164 [Western grey kangaroopox virus]ATI20933.1 hypothetical protein [Western grey kangaroopox virus]ATI21095.1 hypothetical protein [Western grey kangaroopox virus]
MLYYGGIPRTRAGRCLLSSRGSGYGTRILPEGGTDRTPLRTNPSSPISPERSWPPRIGRRETSEEFPIRSGDLQPPPLTPGERKLVLPPCPGERNWSCSTGDRKLVFLPREEKLVLPSPGREKIDSSRGRKLVFLPPPGTENVSFLPPRGEK